MSLVAPGICRYSVQGIIGSRPWACILDMHLETTVLDDRHDVILDQARVLLNAWFEKVLPFTGSAVTLQRVRWVDLNDADGETGERSTSPEHTIPASGGVGTDIAPANAAILVKKRAGGGRRSRNGRMFLPGIPEASAAASNVAGASLTTMQGNMNSFLSSINQTGGVILDYESHLAVVHTIRPTPTAPPEFDSFDHVTSLEVQQLLATQRRRMRG